MRGGQLRAVPRRGAGESNAILLIWNQLGHHGLRPRRANPKASPVARLTRFGIPEGVQMRVGELGPRF